MVPANVYGYAATVAYSLHQPSADGGVGSLQNLMAANFQNPLLLLVVSMILGAIGGFLSGQLAKAISK